MKWGLYVIIYEYITVSKIDNSETRARLDNDPDNGKIGFLFTDGFYHMNNVWLTVDDVIRKWEDCNKIKYGW